MINYSITARAVNPNIFEVKLEQRPVSARLRPRAARFQGCGTRRERSSPLLCHATVRRSWSVGFRFPDEPINVLTGL